MAHFQQPKTYTTPNSSSAERGSVFERLSARIAAAMRYQRVHRHQRPGLALPHQQERIPAP